MNKKNQFLMKDFRHFIDSTRMKQSRKETTNHDNRHATDQ
jgi:hypothetical protein